MVDHGLDDTSKCLHESYEHQMNKPGLTIIFFILFDNKHRSDKKNTAWSPKSKVEECLVTSVDNFEL